MTFFLAAQDTLGNLVHLEEHASFLPAFKRWRATRHQWTLRSARLLLYVGERRLA